MIEEKKEVLNIDAATESFNRRLDEQQKTFIGKIFPVLPEEIPKILIICLNYLLVTIIYSIMKQSKEIISCREINDEAVNWLKLFSLAGVIYIVELTNRLFTTYGNFNGIIATNIVSMLFMCILIVCVLFDRFIFRKFFGGSVETLFSCSCFAVRGLQWTKPMLLLLQYWVLALYYVSFDVICSNIISVVFPTYMSSHLNPGSVKRYFAIFLVVINFTTLFVSIVVRNIVEYAKKIAVKNFYRVYVGFPLLVICLYSLLIVTNYIMEKICNNEKLAVELKRKTEQSKKKTPRFSFDQMFTLLRRYRLLLAMCLVSACYSFYEAFFNTLVSYSYTALNSYYLKHPSEIGKNTFVTSKLSIKFKYSMYETVLSSLFTTMLVLNPLNRMVIDKFGIYVHGLVPIISACLFSIVAFFLCANNYSFTNDGHGILFFPNWKPNQQYLLLEVLLMTLGNVTIRISKFVFYDNVRDLLNVVIEPSNRIMFKGIADGFIPKLMRTLVSLMAILFSFLFNGDFRCTIAISTLIILCLSVLYFVQMMFVAKRYDACKKTNSYITLE